MTHSEGGGGTDGAGHPPGGAHHAPGGHHLSKVVYPPKVAHERALLELSRTGQQRVADKITSLAGSMRFVYLHAVWFTVWILLNQGVFGAGLVFDPFPYGLLTMVVSLEAIFLSTFVMISQNRDARRQNVRADLDYETTVRAEVWAAHIGRSLGLDPVEIETDVQAILRKNNSTTS